MFYFYPYQSLALESLIFHSLLFPLSFMWFCAESLPLESGFSHERHRSQHVFWLWLYKRECLQSWSSDQCIIVTWNVSKHILSTACAEEIISTRTSFKQGVQDESCERQALLRIPHLPWSALSDGTKCHVAENKEKQSSAIQSVGFVCHLRSSPVNITEPDLQVEAVEKLFCPDSIHDLSPGCHHTLIPVSA